MLSANESFLCSSLFCPSSLSVIVKSSVFVWFSVTVHFVHTPFIYLFINIRSCSLMKFGEVLCCVDLYFACVLRFFKQICCVFFLRR